VVFFCPSLRRGQASPGQQRDHAGVGKASRARAWFRGGRRSRAGTDAHGDSCACQVDWDWGPLRAAIASPSFHRWHHTDETQARDKNFAGLLPLWDILFGTYYMPKQQRPRSVGTETPVPAGLIGQMLFPFRKARFKVAPPEAPSGVGGGGARD